jgi:8-oxo-dGTP pyrophosphatase MutT (NUDIX family)
MKPIQKFLSEAKGDSDNSAKCIVKNGNHVLLVRRGRGSAGEGNWDLPGGHIKKDEKPQDGARREVKEEVGLDVEKLTKVTDIIFEKPEKGVKSKMTIYKCDAEGPGNDIYLSPSNNNPDQHYWQQLPRPEHTEYKWVLYKDELERMPMIPELKEVVIKHLKGRENP